MTPWNNAEYSEDGVDLSLIRWMLDLTPAERLEVLQNFVNATLRAREFHGKRLPEHSPDAG
jgi:hypothetical protein